MKMYKRPIILIVIAVLILFLSIAYINETGKDDAPVSSVSVIPHEDITQFKKYDPGELIVKIKPNVKKNFSKVMQSGNIKNAFIKDRDLYRLGSYNITYIKHLFPNYTFKSTKLTPKQEEAVRQREKAMPWQKYYMPALKEKLSRVLLMKFPENIDMELISKEIRTLPYIEYAEPNYIGYLMEFPAGLPNDTYVDPDGNNKWSSGHWGEIPNYEDMWGLKTINMAPEGGDTTWSMSQGEGVVVTVIDSGIDYTHEDLQENIWINPGELSEDFDTNGDGIISYRECIAELQDYNWDGTVNLRDLIDCPFIIDNIDNDGNGFIDDLIGWDFVNNDNDPSDDGTHGSHVAGTIAAIGNNEKGIIGVAPKARLMAVKGFGVGTGTAETFANSLVYAADNGAKVLNNSWAVGLSQVVRDAVEDAYYIMGCVITAAAGNKPISTADSIYPAGIDEVITVAAIDPDDRRADYSVQGNVMDVIAPGTCILSINSSAKQENMKEIGIMNPPLYRLMNGTSMACPHVSGLAALILSKNISLTNEQVKQIIRKSAAEQPEVYPEFDTDQGYGLINAERALLIDSALECSITEPRTMDNFLPGSEIEIKGIVAGADFCNYSIKYKNANVDEWCEIVNDDPTLHPYSLDPEGNPLFDTLGSFIFGSTGDYTLKLTAIDTNGNVFEDRRRIIIDSPFEFDTEISYTIYEGETLTFNINVNDPDGDIVTITPLFPPSGVNFDQITKEFRWTPNYNQAGDYKIVFNITDGLLYDSMEVNITVINNNPPVLDNIGNKSVNEYSTLSFTITANDVDGNSLTYSAANLPQGANFNPATRVFSWTPAYDQSGTYNNIIFSATDGSLSDSEAITITVKDVNRLPQLSVPNNIYRVFPDSDLIFSVSATDPDGDTLTYTAGNLPVGANFNPVTRIFRWRPTAVQAGRVYTVIFAVVDNGKPSLKDSKKVRIDVLNRPRLNVPRLGF